PSGAAGFLIGRAAGGGWAAPPRGAGARRTGARRDSSLAGFLIAGGRGPEALASAVAHGAAAVQLPGSVMPTPRDLDTAAVTVTAEVPTDRVLREGVS
ncbi:1-phosphofructokinase, partial [Streptomyces bottropensis]